MTPPTDRAEPFWSPLRQSLFRSLWLASFASNIGTLMQSVGAAWLMTSLAPVPLLVALVQTATNLPTFLLALPAGALADILDRRRLLLYSQAWMLVSAALLGVLTLRGHTTPWVLLALVFALGLGAAMNAPAWQAIVPELVEPHELSAAIALNSAGFNLARAVGPALGGLLVAAFGPALTFLLNAASFVGVLGVLVAWKRPVPQTELPPERLAEAIVGGVRYIRHAVTLHSVLIRTALYLLSASALWALLPLIARFELGMGPTGYGVLLAFLGSGAVIGAVILPSLQRVVSTERLLAISSLGFACGLAAPAIRPSWPLIDLGLLLAGISWLISLSRFNVTVQAVVPEWIRGRALAVYLLVVFGVLSLGSTLWGALAGWLGLTTTLAVAAGVMIGGMGLGRMVRLPDSDNLNLTPALHWPEPLVAGPLLPEQGPVFVTIEYRIDPERRAEFQAAMRAVRRIRLRDGALRWTLLRDTADPSRYVESFVSRSWLEHLRQHERVTVEDRAIEERAGAFHVGDRPPVISHYVSEPFDEGLKPET